MKKYAKEDIEGNYDGSFFRNLPSQTEFKKVRALNGSFHPPPPHDPASSQQVHTLNVDEKWQMLVLSGVAAHVPLEPALNPQGDTTYTKCAAPRRPAPPSAAPGAPTAHTRASQASPRPILPQLRSRADGEGRPRRVWRH